MRARTLSRRASCRHRRRRRPRAAGGGASRRCSWRASTARAGRGRCELVGGVPVGVQDTPAGALAAADNYVALASQSIEQDPAVFAAARRAGIRPRARSRTLAEAQRVRAGDTQNMTNYRARRARHRGHRRAAPGQLHARRSATVTSWLGGFVWGPHLAPRQTWNLVDTTLRWQAGRWLVLSSDTDATPAPVPSIVYVERRQRPGAGVRASRRDDRPVLRHRRLRMPSPPLRRLPSCSRWRSACSALLPARAALAPAAGTQAGRPVQAAAQARRATKHGSAPCSVEVPVIGGLVERSACEAASEAAGAVGGLVGEAAGAVGNGIIERARGVDDRRRDARSPAFVSRGDAADDHAAAAVGVV